MNKVTMEVCDCCFYYLLFNNLISNREKLLSKKLNPHVELSTDEERQYFFLVRHGIYLSTSEKDTGLIELGRRQVNIDLKSRETNVDFIRFLGICSCRNNRSFDIIS